MTYKTCPICGAGFYQDEPWKKVCLECWKRQKAASNLVQVDADELQEMRQRLSELERWTDVLEADNRRLAAKQQPHALAPGLKDRLHDLIFLCHPDKHAGSHKATEVTAWLLDLRREVAA